MNQGEFKLIVPSKNGVTIKTGSNRPGKQELYYKNLADHLLNGEKLIIDGPWARRPIHILDLANKSVKAGKAQMAKY